MKRIGLACLAAAVLFACQGDQLTPFQTPSALIQDAGHNNGNHFFAFLQPMVSQPSTNGVFDPNLSPVVVVDLLSGACAAVTITYTMSTGPGSERVRVNAADHNYIVNLHTDQVPVSSGCTYRIHVLVGSTELGFADVELFLTQQEAKSLTTGETIALVDGKTLPIKFWIAGGALCASGADCGQGTAHPDRDNVIVTENMRAGVFIPAGAVDADVTIIVESVDDRPCIAGLVGQTFEGRPGAAANSCYQFRTDPPLPGGTFNTNVIVGICVELSGVSETQEPKIQIFQFDDGDSPQLRPLPNAPAPFLPCDPSYQAPIGLAKPGLLNLAARALGRLLSPRPLFASTRTMVFDLGAGGSTDGFSLFTWGLVTNMAMNDGNGQTTTVGSAVATPPSVRFVDSTGAPVDSVPVSFTPGSGGSVTDGSTKSGRGGVSGVARVGSWTLGSVGPNTLTASAPPLSGVTPETVTFTATGTSPADLTIHDLSVSPAEPAAGVHTLSAIVSNSGGTAAAPSTVSLCAMQFTLSGAGGTCQVFPGPSVPAGGSVPVSASVGLSAPGAYTVTASVDTFDVVPESDETNNKAVGPTFGVAMITFESYPDGSPTCGDCKVGGEFATRGVTFSFTRAAPDDTLPHLCNSTPNDPAPILIPELVNHGVTAPAIGDPCNGWLSGDMTLTFAPQPDTVEFRLRGPDPGSPSVFFPVTAYDGSGAALPAGQIVHVIVGTYTPAGPGATGTRREERVTVINPVGKISRVVVGESVSIKFLDNLRIVVLGP